MASSEAIKTLSAIATADQDPITHSKDTVWSKEAVISLSTIFIMVLLSILGFLGKTWVIRKTGRIRSDDVEEGSPPRHLMRPQNIEAWEQRDIKSIRRHQQDTYSAIVRIGRRKVRETVTY
ncbi:hypothetical protein BDV96DRAFT_587541 [Lophiotrema nucula]|uniref:Uncharacterized protein n=1 Tax=Lophiotrema nucula TaxID=690887 RepID=A0A6A5YMT6_9PLEO|nr:hypothetical protein BDV96DRAFT_587541 [Lophiotrema nucula]